MEKEGNRLKVHIKVDTGMGRLGLVPDSLAAGVTDEADAVSQIDIHNTRLTGLDVEGIIHSFRRFRQRRQNLCR